MSNKSSKFELKGPSFKPEYYHGKDIIHEGCLLKLNPTLSWSLISAKARNKIKNSLYSQAIEIKKMRGNKQDIKKFRTIWFDPNDDTLPERLNSKEILYFAYQDKELMGGLILTPTSPNTLYMHNLGSSPKGKQLQVPSLLLWHAVNELKDSRYHYIDVGVSFRKPLYEFFKHFKTESYPIIFEAPSLIQPIKLCPLTNVHLQEFYEKGWGYNRSLIDNYFGANHTVFPDSQHALYALLKHLYADKDGTVSIYSSISAQNLIDNFQAVFKYFHIVSSALNKTTKVVVVAHEYGIPHPLINNLHSQCQNKNIPLIELCLWGFGSAIDKETFIGDVGEYVIYDLPTMLPMQFGSVLKGLFIPDEDMWSVYKCLDFYKREIIYRSLTQWLSEYPVMNQRKRNNYMLLASWFTRDGYPPLINKIHEKIYPSGLIIPFQNIQTAKSLKRLYDRFQVQVEILPQKTAVVLPVHQSLSKVELKYIYAIFRGYMNLSSNYHRSARS